MDDALLNMIGRSVAAFRNHRDVRSITDPELLFAAAQVLSGAFEFADVRTSTPRWAVDVEAVAAVAWLHLCRHDALGSGGGQPDLRAGLQLMAVVGLLEPSAVPPGVRDVVSARVPTVAPHRVAAVAWACHAVIHLARGADTGDRDALRTAAALWEGAAQTLPAEDPDRAEHVNRSAVALEILYEHTDVLADLDAALAALGTTVDTTPPGHHDRPKRQARLGQALLTRFSRTGERGSLDAAVDACRAASEAVPEAGPDRSGLLSTLAVALQTRFDVTEDPDDLDAAVGSLRSALSAAGLTSEDRAGYLGNLGLALRTRFEHSSDTGDLDGAVEAGRSALSALPAQHPDRAAHLANLGATLCSRYQRTGSLDDLDLAVSTGMSAVEATPEGRQAPVPRLAGLGMSLALRFEAGGALEDLDAAISALRSACSQLPEHHVDAGGHLSHLSNALQTRHERSGKAEDIDEAVRVGRRAVAATPAGHPALGAHRSNLAAALLSSYQTTREQEDLDAAVELSRSALAAVPDDHPDHCSMLSVLGLALDERARLTKTAEDRATAMDALRRVAGAYPADHPDRALHQYNLGATLLDLAKSAEEDQSAFMEAARSLREAARSVTASAPVRLRAARGWAEAAARSGRWQEALEAAEHAVEHLATTTWHGLDLADRMEVLGDLAGLSGDIAAIALNTGDVESAVVLLERSRGILLAQALDARSDRTWLTEHDPVLASRLDRLRSELDAPRGIRIERSAASGSPFSAAAERYVGRRRELAREWDRLVAEARSLPGGEDFMRAPDFTQLRGAAAEGPVVLVNISVYRCDAIVLTSAGARVVPLPEWTSPQVAQRAFRLMAALADTSSTSSLSARLRAGRLLDEALDWLWNTLAVPVLDALDLPLVSAPAVPLPRLWWCPVGVSAFLPLHAAGASTPEGAAASLPDRVVSSYTSTLRALTHSRSARRPVGYAGPMLVAAVPATPGMRALEHAERELDVVRGHVPAATVLLGPEVTRERITTLLPHHSCWHFAGHGRQDPAERTAAVYGWDHGSAGPLTIADIALLNLEQGKLAFVSACDTARGSVRLRDESVHISGALQLAGYTHVVASQWSVTDSAAPEVADGLYRRLLDDRGRNREDRGDDGGVIDATRAGRALHGAVQDLRAGRASPLLWAAYIHTGP
ncbi:CHAT domain-containing protein [Streptomyces luteogriseus]|uniref:CHAT domain-containing protein n=1 Tax=Streptomyces luteogriseus TaxID=68233 RepID=UPI0037A428E8